MDTQQLETVKIFLNANESVKDVATMTGASARDVSRIKNLMSSWNRKDAVLVEKPVTSTGDLPTIQDLIVTLFKEGRARKTIASLLQVDMATVTNVLKERNARRTKNKSWTPEESLALISLRSRKVPFAECARVFGRTVQACYQQHYHLTHNKRA